jgi:hypothetical protein
MHCSELWILLFRRLLPTAGPGVSAQKPASPAKDNDHEETQRQQDNLLGKTADQQFAVHDSERFPAGSSQGRDKHKPASPAKGDDETQPGAPEALAKNLASYAHGDADLLGKTPDHKFAVHDSDRFPAATEAERSGTWRLA